MSFKLILVPRLNSNEDDLLLTAINCKSGDWVQLGTHLFDLESSKVTQEVLSEDEGFFYFNELSVGTLYKVNHPIGIVSKSEMEPEEISALLMSHCVGHDIQLPKKDLPLMSNKCVVVGAQGHARQVIDLIEENGYEIIGCIAADEVVGTKVYNDVRVVGNDNDLTLYKQSGVKYAFVGVGALGNNALREKIFSNLIEIGFSIPPLIAGKTSISRPVKFGEGVVVLNGAIIGPNVIIGNNTIINQGVNISHDTIIGSHSNITPGCMIAGTCKIGDRVTLGMGATIYAGVSISDDITIRNLESVNADRAN